MKQKLSILFLAFAMLCAMAPTTTHAATVPSVVISEVAWAGSSLSTADEWLELTNTTTQPVDVSEWTLTGAATSPLTLPAASIIQPDSTFLISNYDKTATNSTLNVHPQYITTAVSLPNDKLKITLARADGTLVDTAGNGGAPFKGGPGGTGGTTNGRFRTMERLDASADGSTAAAWEDATSSIGFKTGTLDLGTPGMIDDALQSEIMAMNTPVVSPPVASATIDTTTTTPSTTSSDVVATDPTSTLPSDIDTATSGEPMCTDVDTTSDATIVSTTDTTTTPSTTDSTVVQNDVTSLPTIDTTSTTTSEPVVATTATNSTDTAITSSTPQNNFTTTYGVGAIEVNELYPHPASGEAEWVELKNTTTDSIPTTGWSLIDASGAVTALPNVSMEPGGYLVIENPKGNLNNDGDTVIVEQPNGEVVDSVKYSSTLGGVPAIGESLIRTGMQTLVLTTTPTKDADNVATEKTSATSTSSSSSTSTTTDVNSISVVATNSRTTDTSSTTAATTTTTVTPSTSSGNIVASTNPNIHLSEFYPNTGGNDSTDEFIELSNDGDTTASLDGWSLTDASGTRFAFAKTDSIAPHAYLAVMRPQSHITLNNTGDTITLVAPDGSVADSQTYETAQSLFAYAKINGVWSWTGKPSPNEPNVLSTVTSGTQTVDPSGTSTVSTTSSNTNSTGTISARVLNITDAIAATDGTRVTVRGFVSVLPNVFNSQIIYLQDETGGVQIYKSDCLFPALTLGQVITVTGTLSHPYGEARIRVSNMKSLAVSSSVQDATPASVSDSSNAGTGSLITIAGTVLSKSATQAQVNVDGENWTVDFPKGTPIDTAVFTKGAQVNVSGILTLAKGVSHIKPRSDSDVSVTASTISTATTDANPVSKQTLAIVLALLALVAIAALKLRPHIYALMNSYGRKQTHIARS